MSPGSAFCSGVSCGSTIPRRAVLTGFAGLAGSALLPLCLTQAQAQEQDQAQDQAQDADGFFSRLTDRAARLAAIPYDPPTESIPQALAALSYDALRDIRFDPNQAIWRGETPFEVQLLHLGRYLRTPVRVHTVENGRPKPHAYRPDLFSFGRTGLDPATFSDLGFSGLRVHHALNDANIMDELIVFQGASYFRALCAGAVYGLSARGVAVNTARPEGEEFPGFTDLYVERPTAAAPSIVLYALLDGPSLAGAYRFEVTPGSTTVTSVQCRLFARRPVEQLGIGVLTSMFDFAPIDRVGVDDFRPRVHDSQGLSMQTRTGEWLWRPLHNPDRVEMNVFRFADPAGFGLMQRVRRFDRHQDLEALYHRRPSAWISPRGGWGEGEVILVEIPTPDETNDNIVAFWKPAEPFAPGRPLALNYDILWTLEGPRPDLAWCLDTAAGHVGLPSTDLDDTARRLGRKWVIDFVEGPLQILGKAEDVTVVTSADWGRITGTAHVLNPDTGGVRVFLDTMAKGASPMNLRCHLARDGAPVSETWTMQWRPPTAA